MTIDEAFSLPNLTRVFFLDGQEGHINKNTEFPNFIEFVWDDGMRTLIRRSDEGLDEWLQDVSVCEENRP